ncbi:membrane-associated phospholipid phosphatase [Nostoc sp. PCC 7524]|uniref:phosphatase PAP2 family protein n=1 Tax=Nostoc sp. (strain ATCC 29411 / PCC 7524) TaxID=28072 RepID=UPI00029F17EE|nr:phosphatase PAP2 family protein [Nostoc sp. PCC 7524]AFY47582.1 membrane-associated phospholipid phosphatase [Nostoc sp. PCC 7524]
MNGHLSTNGSSLIQAIHTAVKGRVRFKVSGLHLSHSCKNYIEWRLSQEKNILQYSANHLTGNVLVIFDPDYSLSAIASLLQNIVLDYRQEIAQQSVSIVPTPIQLTAIPIQPQLEQLNSQLIVGSAVATVLVLSSGLVYKNGFDESILLGIQKLHTPLLDTIMKGITALGEPLVFGSICSALGINLWYNQRRREATTLGMATVGAVGLNLLFKELFRRARPALWDYIVNAVHYSFPSGHAMVSTAIYGCIGYILAKEFPQWRKQILGSITVLIWAIGLSRLYLGVHWPTDVLAGYAAGILWLIACILYLEWKQKYTFSGNFQKILPELN